MKKHAYSFPIPKDKVEEWLEFVQEINTGKRAAFTAMHKRIGVTKESWYLDETSEGYSVLVYTEAKSEKFIENFKNDNTEFSNWYRDQVYKIQNLDLNQPVKMPKLVLDWIE